MHRRDDYPPEVAWKRFDKLLDNMIESAKPYQRTLKREASYGYSDTQTPSYTSKGVSQRHGDKSHE